MATTTKDTFKQVLDKQNALMETLTKNANATMELFAYDKQAAEKGMEIAKEYFEKTRTMAEDMMKPENLEKYFEKAPAFYNKALELNMEFFNKTTEYYRNLWMGFSPETAQQTAQKVSELTRNSLDAVVETTTANTKLMQEAAYA